MMRLLPGWFEDYNTRPPALGTTVPLTSRVPLPQRLNPPSRLSGQNGLHSTEDEAVKGMLACKQVFNAQASNACARNDAVHGVTCPDGRRSWHVRSPEGPWAACRD